MLAIPSRDTLTTVLLLSIVVLAEATRLLGIGVVLTVGLLVSTIAWWLRPVQQWTAAIRWLQPATSSECACSGTTATSERTLVLGAVLEEVAPIDRTLVLGGAAFDAGLGAD
jgi:hypothetical protein